ncbi:MAG: glutamate--tRNA ligase, partial [Actinomycetales bacterium]
LKDSQAQKVLQSAISSLESVAEWNHQEIENALRAALLDEMGLKPRIAFSPVRIAITGSHISPPLFESMELLGRERSMQRLRAAIN